MSVSAQNSQRARRFFPNTAAAMPSARAAFVAYRKAIETSWNEAASPRERQRLIGALDKVVYAIWEDTKTVNDLDTIRAVFGKGRISSIGEIERIVRVLGGTLDPGPMSLAPAEGESTSEQAA